MERVASVEEKIRRAEEIYEKRKQGNVRPVATVNVNDKKDIKLLKKMLIQMLICVSIYLIIYTIQSNNYVFSQDFINKINELISYDTNFMELYNNAKNYIMNLTDANREIIPPEESIGGAEENAIAEEKNIDDNQEKINEEINSVQNMSQEEQDINSIKNTTTFIKPVIGVISSKYGQRDTATGSVPKNHTGTDIAANMGTKIIAATDGEVVLASEEGDYRKTLKNTDRRSECNICTL